MPTAPASSPSLDLLAARAASGDAAAFEQLVVATSPTIYALALRLVGDEHDARDVVQETYLRAYRAISRFRGEAAVSTWLYRICANCASSHLRRRRHRSVEVLHDELTLPDPAAERALGAIESSQDDRGRLVAALGSLPASLRAVVVLHDIYDLPHDAIAAELGISRAASKVRLHRARRRLRELLFVPAAAPALNDGPVAPVLELGALGPSSSSRRGRKVG